MNCRAVSISALLLISIPFAAQAVVPIHSDTVAVERSLAPVVTLTMTPSTGTGTLPLTVDFTATCTVSTCVGYVWDFGDGTIGTDSASQTHTYTTAGEYYPIVAVTNAKGQGANATTTITVTPVVVTGAYGAYTGTDIVIPDAPPNFGTYTKNGLVAYDTSYTSHQNPPTTLGRIARCTDVNSIPQNGLVGSSAGQGGATSAIMWNAGSPPTLIHLNTNSGGNYITRFDAKTASCGNAILNSQDLTFTITGSQGASQASFGDGQFDLANPNVWYGFGPISFIVTSTPTTVLPFNINTTTGNFTVGNPVADFKYFLPIGAQVQPWQPNTDYSFGQYVSYMMSPSQYKPWISLTAYDAGDLVWPNTSTGCAFVATINGISGTQQPTWPTVNGVCGLNPTVVRDGTEKWRSLGSGAKFIYQLTAPATGAKSGTSFNLVGNPDVLSNVTDGTSTWVNVGVDVQDPVWASLTNVGPNAANVTQSHSTNTYGAAPNTLGGANGQCTYSNCTGDQGTGQFDTAYDTVANVGQLFNTLTEIQSTITCVGGAGYDCAGGTWRWTTAGKVTGLCPFYLHDSSGSLDAKIAFLSTEGGFMGSDCPAQAASVWFPYQSPFNASTQVIKELATICHVAYGYEHMSGLADSGLLYGFQLGPYALTPLFSGVGSDYPISWQAAPCLTTSPSDWAPGDEELPCSPQSDDHLSWAWNPGDDSTPVAGAFYAIDPENVNATPGSAYWGEVVAYSTVPAWTDDTDPSSAQKQWRFGHYFNFQTNLQFNTQFAIGQWSQDGHWFAVGTDNWGGFGSTTGLPPVLPVPVPSATCAGGFPWNPNATYALGTMITPVKNLGGGGTISHTYQAVVAGASGSKSPAFSNTTALGTQVTDGSVVWQDVGPGTCRGEVELFEMK